MKKLLFGFLVCGALSLPLAAQVSSASLTGLVTDPSDAVISRVKVTAHSSATNLDRTTETDSIGYYSFPSLPIGAIELTVEGSGFQPVKQLITLGPCQ